MSLLSEAMKPCRMMTPTISADGYGGHTTVWKAGTRFMAAIVFDGSNRKEEAEAEKAPGTYTVTTDRSTVLKFHQVFKRCSDRKVFRVTSNGDDNATPVSAGLDMRQVTAEEWELPNG